MNLSLIFFAFFTISSVFGAAQFQLFDDRAGEFRFRLLADNHEIILASEGYTTKTSASAGVDAVRREAVDESSFEIKMTANDKWHFVLKAGNGEIIGTSEVYESESNANIGIASVQSNAPGAPAKDLTVSGASNPGGVFELFLDAGDEFRFRLIASNGEVILASEGYTSKSSALGGIDSVRENSLSPTNFESLQASNDLYYFTLKAQNGQVIGVSELYSSLGARGVGLFAVQSTAHDAPLRDLTLGDDGKRVGRFLLFRDLATKIRFALYATNGRNILASEAYESLQAAQNGIASVRTNAVNEERYKKLTSTNGLAYFTLRAGNNQVIGVSQLYQSTSGRDNGIQSVLNHAPEAEIVDESALERRKFDVFRDAETGLTFRYNLRAANSQIVLAGTKFYDTRAELDAVIARVRIAVADEANFELKDASDGQLFFVLKDAQGNLGVSETYVQTSGRSSGILSVQNTAPAAVINEVAWLAPPSTAPTTPKPTQPLDTTQCSDFIGCDVCQDAVDGNGTPMRCKWCGTCVDAADECNGTACPTTTTTEMPITPLRVTEGTIPNLVDTITISEQPNQDSASQKTIVSTLLLSAIAMFIAIQ